MAAFDKFTRRAKQVLSLAQEEARHFNHPYVGTEHILLALIREGEGVAARVLQMLGVELQKARSAVEFIAGRGDSDSPAGELELTGRVRKVLEHAVEEARALGHSYVGTEHLLLGLARQQDGIACGVLDIMSVSLEHVRAHVVRLLDKAGARTARPVRPADPEQEALLFKRLFHSGQPPASPVDGPGWQVQSGAQLIGGPQSRPAWRDEVLPDSFDQQLLSVLELAGEEARLLGHSLVGTPHLLLGLLRDADDEIAGVLARVGHSIDQVYDAAIELLSKVSESPTRSEEALDFSLRASEAVRYAAYEAGMLRHSAIGCAHLLLGLARIEELDAQSMLRKLGIDPARLRHQVLRALSPRAGELSQAELGLRNLDRSSALPGPDSIGVGDVLQARIVEAGRGREQGVGYLDERRTRTKVIVEDARSRIGELVSVVVTKMQITRRGCVIYARLATSEEEEEGQAVSA
jgi:ATP-dependent Clp protease ATP-binding subunit ClpA